MRTDSFSLGFEDGVVCLECDGKGYHLYENPSRVEPCGTCRNAGAMMFSYLEDSDCQLQLQEREEMGLKDDNEEIALIMDILGA